MRTLTILLAGLLVAAPLAAGERGDARLDQALRDLSGDLRAVSVAAHPDDEDSATLALLRRKLGVRTTVVVVTRGEGGQNEIGDELYEDLAVVREAETLAAAGHTGSAVRFLSFPDFGYSRTAEETFKEWGKEELVRRLVRVLREVRPELVITNHDTETGHGHHQAVGIALLEAFDAAADPAAFPEEGPAFAVSKLFVASEPEAADARPDVGGVDPVRGLSYAEMGLHALREHRSQGTWDWVKIAPGPIARPYRLVRSRVADGKASLTAGLPVPRPEWLEEANRSGTRREILRRVLALDPSPRRDRALAAVLGVEVRLTVEDGPGVPGGTVEAKALLRNDGTLPFVLRSLRIEAFGGATGGPAASLAPGEVATARAEVAIPLGTAPNRPRRDHLDREAGAGPNAVLRAVVSVPGSGETVTVLSRREIPVFPPVTLEISELGRVFRPVLGESRLAVVVRNHAAEEREVRLEAAFRDTDQIDIRVPRSFAVPARGQVTRGLDLSARPDLIPGLYEVEVRADDAPAVRAPVRVLDLEVPAELHVGVVRTYGDEAFEALEAMGLRPDLLSDEDLAVGDLSRYDTIWLGIRPFLARPVLRDANARLLAWVKGGGNLVVNYSKDREWSPGFAPFPLTIGRDRVTRENAPLLLEAPNHRLLHRPNEIADHDFDGWIQERGLYFPADYDPNDYRAILTTYDPGRKPIPGMLVAKYGEGTWIYTCLGWYRQLRILNPGAWKMLANLVSLPWPR